MSWVEPTADAAVDVAAFAAIAAMVLWGTPGYEPIGAVASIALGKKWLGRRR